jgi:uncharacterized membrane protein (DUF441 family)
MKRLLVLAVPLVLWLAVAAAPALAYARTLVIRGRGTTVRVPSAGHSGISVGLVIVGLAILTVIISGIVYISIAEWRRSVPPATGAGEPTPLLRDRSEAGDQHRAA